MKAQEKEAVLIEYEEARRSFEAVAENLYNLLKKKEVFTDDHHAQLTLGLSISEIRQHQFFLEGLERSIQIYQTKVIEARHKMQIQEQILKEKNIEVRKYEILKEKDFQSFLEEIKHNERLLMDEISIQQHLNRQR